MKSWARIHRDTADSKRLSELIAKHPLADALFWAASLMVQAASSGCRVYCKPNLTVIKQYPQ